MKAKVYFTREITPEKVLEIYNLLNKDGILLISYLYETVKDSKYQEDWNLIYDLEKTLSILKEYHPEFISFIGVKGLKFNDENIKDSVLVYKKD